MTDPEPTIVLVQLTLDVPRGATQLNVWVHETNVNLLALELDAEQAQRLYAGLPVALNATQS